MSLDWESAKLILELYVKEGTYTGVERQIQLHVSEERYKNAPTSRTSITRFLKKELKDPQKWSDDRLRKLVDEVPSAASYLHRIRPDLNANITNISSDSMRLTLQPPNRSELIRAMYQVKDTAIEYIWAKERLNQMNNGVTISPITQDEVDKAYQNYVDADKRLEQESLVAGTSYNECTSSFRNKVKLHFWIRYYEHENRPDGTAVLTELENAMTECIKAIDDISQNFF